MTSLIINGVDSPPRLFYARLLYRKEFCGATVLSDRFLLTAGHCVNKIQHLIHILKIEVGDFTQKESPKKKYSIERIFLNPLYSVVDHRPINDIALIKTRVPIENGWEIAFRVCNSEETVVTPETMSRIIGFCGMGSFITEATHSAIPGKLKQMVFRQSLLRNSDNLYPPVRCPEELICVKPLFDKGNICTMDDGGPLYMFFCGTMMPDCLMGIASFSQARSDTPLQSCNNGSYFTNVPVFYDWIDYIMNHYIE